MKLFGLKDENGKEYVIEADLRSCFRNIINVMPIEPTPKFKVGDWVIRKDGNILKRIKYVDKYAFLCDDEISGHLFENADGYCAYRLATSSEIESHLIKVAEKKGLLKNGILLAGAGYNTRFKFLGGTIKYDKKEDALMEGGMFLYWKGKWATIIPDKKPLPKTKKELMDLLVHIAVHNSHQHVRETLDEYED